MTSTRKHDVNDRRHSHLIVCLARPWPQWWRRLHHQRMATAGFTRRTPTEVPVSQVSPVGAHLSPLSWQTAETGILFVVRRTLLYGDTVSSLLLALGKSSLFSECFKDELIIALITLMLSSLHCTSSLMTALTKPWSKSNAQWWVINFFTSDSMIVGIAMFCWSEACVSCC